jgi:hypothetical protein
MRITYFILFTVFLIGCGRQPKVVLVESSGSEEGSDLTSPSRSPGAETAADGFGFPNDQGGKLLADLLVPKAKQGSLPSDLPAKPLRFSTPRFLEHTELPLTPSEAQLPQKPLSEKLRPARPRSVPKAEPLSEYRSDPTLPQLMKFPAGERAHEWSPEVTEPTPLPILAQKQSDTPSADDPTGEVSLMAALATVPPPRTTPASFLRLTLPEPFEFRKAVRLRAELPESAVPMTATPKLPGR